MPGKPIVFVSHFAIKPGHEEDIRAMWDSVAAELQATKPATAAYLAYLSDDANQLSIVHVFPDADAMGVHFIGAGERAMAAYEHIVPDGWEVYGSPAESNLAELRASAAAAGVSLEVAPEPLGGFLRTGR